MSERIVQGDTLQVRRFVIHQSNGLATDLTGLTARARYRIAGGTEKLKSLSIASPATAGLADLIPDTTTWDAPGRAVGRVELLDAGTLIGKTPQFFIDVERP